jgi:hypothetical protein
MANPPKNAADIPVGRDELEMWQENIQEAQTELHDTLEKIKEELDAGNAIDPNLFQQAVKRHMPPTWANGCSWINRRNRLLRGAVRKNTLPA